MLVAGITAGAIALGLVAGSSSIAAPAGSTPSEDSVALPGARAANPAITAEARPNSGTAPSAYLLKLKPAPTARVYDRALDDGRAAARSAARGQRTRIRAAQAEVAEALPDDTSVMFRTHTVLSAIAVQADPDAAGALREIQGVESVHPIVPKEFENSYAVGMQGAPAAWGMPGGDAGDGIKVAIVDTGVDYTHANFGGPGTTAAYEQAHQAETSPIDPSLLDGDKFIGGYDFVGDTYQPNEDEDNFQPNAMPDPNPIDCEGHGSHVAGSAAGYGVESGGSTYSGAYDAGTDIGSMEIGPGMAPKAQVLAYKVFGCEGSTNWITAAIDKAADPNGDGDPSDGADVINLSVGSDFGSGEDGDSVAANAAVDLGVSVVASAGNSSDRTDISGSPGNASKVITVANSQDASSRIDGVAVSIDSADGLHGAQRSFAYDWDEDPDLAGEVVRAPAGDRAGCSPFPAGSFTGKVVMVEWNDANPECGSAQRAGNLHAAGAIGFIFANSTETFSLGITGSEEIPGVMIVKSGADQLRTALDESRDVEVQGTSINTVTQTFPADNDKVNASSSRGLHVEGNVKPDVAAVGTSVFSTAVGTGSAGTSETGTSMSSPMVAGLAALVRGAHPEWSPLKVKADIMNTATHDITVNGNLGPASDVFSPVRVGSGRVDADHALSNEVLAYNPVDGTVSVSFGAVQAKGPMTLSKTVTVENTGVSSVTYDTSYLAATTVPGVEYSVSPSQVTVAAGSTATVTVTLEVTDVEAMSKTVDPTIGRMSTALDLPRETLSEAAGRLVLEPSGGGAKLRVPVYAAPRPASVLSQAGSIEFPDDGMRSAQIELTGKDLGQDGSNGTGDSDPDNDIFSVGAGFELTAESGQSPACTSQGQKFCVQTPVERGGDVKHVGFTSSNPYAGSPADARGYFALSTRAPFAIPSDRIHFQVEIDVDGDRKVDLYLTSNRLVQESGQSEDVFVASLLDPSLPKGQRTLDLRGVNGRFGDLDTALYDTDTIVLPFALEALKDYGIDASNPRVNYGISTFYSRNDHPIDLVGIDPVSKELQLSVDLFEPGIRVAGALGDGLLYDDVAGDTLTVTRDGESYRADGGKGLMLVHFHNETGSKSQIVGLSDRKPESLAPKMEAKAKGAKPKNGRGWFHTAVTVSFTCTPGTAALIGPCPSPVKLAKDGRDLSVSRTITASDGQSATAGVGGIMIDRTKPKVRIKGVRKGRAYRRAPKGRCVASDKTSKVASCKLKRKRKGKRVTYVATAKDKAGNKRTLKVRVRLKR